jgi:hypothetical protein
MIGDCLALPQRWPQPTIRPESNDGVHLDPKESHPARRAREGHRQRASK